MAVLSEDELLADIVRRTRIRYGEVHLSIWDGELFAVADRAGRRSKDEHLKLFAVQTLVANRQFRTLCHLLAAVYNAPHALILIKVANGRFIHVECTRVMPLTPEWQARYHGLLATRVPSGCREGSGPSGPLTASSA